MDRTDLGDRMKNYEKEGRFLLDMSLPIVIRLDGNSFSKFTKKQKFEKPFDKRMTKAMEDATKAMVERCSDFVIAYTQSDEITLVLAPRKGDADPKEADDIRSAFMSGRLDKICSLLATRCTIAFNRSLEEQGLKTYAEFDCRAFNVPNEVEAMNAVLWRQYDCWKNYVGIVAHWRLQGSMHKVSTDQKIKLLADNNIDIHKDYDKKYHYGTVIYKKLVKEPLSEELKKFPSNKGKEFVERKVLTEDYFLVKDKRDLWEELIKQGFTSS